MKGTSPLKREKELEQHIETFLEMEMPAGGKRLGK